MQVQRWFSPFSILSRSFGTKWVRKGSVIPAGSGIYGLTTQDRIWMYSYPWCRTSGDVYREPSLLYLRKTHLKKKLHVTDVRFFLCKISLLTSLLILLTFPYSPLDRTPTSPPVSGIVLSDQSERSHLWNSRNPCKTFQNSSPSPEGI